MFHFQTHIQFGHDRYMHRITGHHEHRPVMHALTAHMCAIIIVIISKPHSIQHKMRARVGKFSVYLRAVVFSSSICTVGWRRAHTHARIRAPNSHTHARTTHAPASSAPIARTHFATAKHEARTTNRMV